jgi:putative Ca2+/H+ antiporter (TMEM165/GDT1 family)
VEAIVQSFLMILASEMGDKTQLLALVLVMRFNKPWTIMAGILVATLANHALAAWLGGKIASTISPQIFNWGLAAVFIGFGLWILIPDKEEELKTQGTCGAFLTTVVAFFFAEMGDKTQLATAALGANFRDVLTVTVGTTLGMLAADGLAVFFGKRLTTVVPMRWIRIAASLLFLAFGVALLLRGVQLGGVV